MLSRRKGAGSGLFCGFFPKAATKHSIKANQGQSRLIKVRKTTYYDTKRQNSTAAATHPRAGQPPFNIFSVDKQSHIG
jgi:hypothetical protein